MVTALPDDEVKEILYHAMPNLWMKKMTEQGYNYLDRYIQEMSGFFETRIENLETPTPPPAVRSQTRKKKKNSKNRKAFSFEDSDEDSSDEKKPLSRKKFCRYHGKCSHSTDECTTLKALIKQAKSNKFKGCKKGGEKTYTKYEVKVFKRRKKLKQESRTLRRWKFQGL